MLKTGANRECTPLEVFDDIRKMTAEDRSGAFLYATKPFFGWNREGAKVNEGIKLDFWRLGMMGSNRGEYDFVHEFFEVDYTEDLKMIGKPTFVMHGDDDQIVAGAEPKVCKRAPHGLYQTIADRINADRLAFIET